MKAQVSKLPHALLLAALLAAGNAGAQPPSDAAVASAPPVLSDADADLGDADLDGAEEPRSQAPALVLEWSENPGVHEGDLHRRFRNPLYLESRRQIGEAHLLAAKRRDAEQAWKVLERVIDLLSSKQRMSKFELASQMGDALLRIDEETWAALRVGGEAYSLAATVQDYRTWLLKEWQVAALADPGVKALLDAEARIPSVETHSPSIRFLALVQAGDADMDSEQGRILRHEFATALMSEEPNTIRNVYRALRGELKRTMQQQLTLLLEEIEREEIEFEGRDQKVAAVTALLGLSPPKARVGGDPPPL